MTINLTSHLRTLTAGLFLCATLLAAPVSQAAISEWVDIDIENGALWLKTKVGGLEGFSLIDSGAQINSINTNFLTAAGQSYRTGRPMILSGVYGSEKRRTYHSIPVELFGTNIDFRGLVDIDFGGPNQQLILGGPFLQLHVFQFDYPNKRMRIITRDSVNMKKLKNVKSKKDFKTGDPIVQVNLNNEKKVWLLLDTGSNGGILIERPIAAKRDWLTKYPTRMIDVKGVTTGGQMEQFNLPALTIGDYELENVLVEVPLKGKDLKLFERESEVGSHLNKSRSQYQGILGYDILKHFVVTVDYKGGYVHLEAPAPEAEPAADTDTEAAATN